MIFVKLANSGIYKYRTKKEIDSIYNWGFGQIEQSKTYREFYNLLCTITDYEGSLHNDTYLPKKIVENLRAEESGYFPIPIKIIEEKVLVNFKNLDLPIGSEILTINNEPIAEILPNFYKYYTTDGYNITGKTVGINVSFSKYYRLHYGKKDSFKVSYYPPNSNKTQTKTLQSVSYKKYYQNFNKRHSRKYDGIYYNNLPDDQMYVFSYEQDSIAKLTHQYLWHR